MSVSGSRHTYDTRVPEHRVSAIDDWKADCQGLLTQFRVSELKELLGKLKQSSRGRKAELFQRANEILRHGSSKIQIHIREIYKKGHSTGSHSPYRKIAQRGSHVTKASTNLQSHQGYVVHPDVKFKAHPFFNKLESIIRPTALASTAMTSSGSFSMRLQFHLSPRQVQQIYRSKNSQGEYLNQILIRFARQETSCEQEDFYPKQCYIKVNDNYVAIPGYIPQYSHRPDYKRNGKPVNITNCIKTSAAQTNDIVLYWGRDDLYPQGFCVTVDHVESLSSSDLLSRLKSQGVRSPDISRALVKEKLLVDRNSEISATSLRISLICPLGKLRMTNPCRTMHCTHLQCFDASIFLQMNERKPRWVCPVCDKPAPMSMLFIDGFLKEICEQSSSNDIQFEADGSWKPFSEKRTSLNVMTPDSGRKCISVHSTPEKDLAGDSQSDPIVIDLTLSDSEAEQNSSVSKRPHSRKLSTSSSTSSEGNTSEYCPSCPTESDGSSQSLRAQFPPSFTVGNELSLRPSRGPAHETSWDALSRVATTITQGTVRPSVITSHSTMLSPSETYQQDYDLLPIDDSLLSLLNFDPSDQPHLID